MDRYAYGWRGKFGFICPSLADTVLLEFYKLLPEGVLCTSADQRVQNLVEKDFTRAVATLEEAARVLDYEEVQAMIIGGTPPLLQAGFDTPEKLIEDFERKFKKPFSTTPTSEVRAMQSLGLRKILLVTPYKPALLETVKKYFEYKGFEVVHCNGANIDKNVDLVKHTGHQLYRLVREAVQQAPGSFDGIQIACPRWPVVDVAEALEYDFGVPVVSTAQALVWQALTMLNIREIKPKSGLLFGDFKKTS